MKNTNKSLARGASSDSAPGPKPAVAFGNQEAAEKNIKAKLAIIEGAMKAYAKDSIAKSLEGLPSSKRQFYLWTPISALGEKLSTNNPDTAKQYPLLLKRIESAIKLVGAERGRIAAKPSVKENSLAAARRSSSLHKALREIAERELIAQRRLVQIAKKDLEQVQASLKSTQKEAAALHNNLRAEIAALSAENSRLVKLSKTVVLLKR